MTGTLNETENRAKELQEAMNPSEARVPELLEFHNDRHRQFYELLYHSRDHADWSDADLMYLHGIANYQVQIENCWKTLNEEGLTERNAQGNLKTRPEVEILSKFQYHQKAMIQSLSLVTTGNPEHSSNQKAADRAKHAKKREEEELMKRITNGSSSIAGLLAAPAEKV